ncbi:prepilin-type N-terminal cleavage/methylation domain-containing protein [Ferribacterium limneticum]|uniref:prepilin-type N-terminal cleavage/methylation domain-containing protein n=1 Tax=Ferribacterium limneticum TaxID=76259 RepID=UPI001CFB8152|nr:prepilin-type N-terminal cleavage/methylation domain-containing protein [Ferribacterium limneticum]UCV27512.1 prepilin-type N-terminal cleavage/methylation domain-containing protein [Ferribacterium limneticum]UCV31429.1 prepilin-type N-terminal cleavage/methylation domain-containing protein [Ferribacterium limneticum]
MRRATEFHPVSADERGFTLVEVIVVIVISGIVLGLVGMFGWRQVDAYVDVSTRAELSDGADTALRRVARDLQSALPNSVRQSGNFLEYVPIRDAGRYRADVDNGGGGNPLDFTNAADNSFDVLGPAVTIVAGDQLVIFNLGQTGSDVYAGSSRRAIETAPGGVSSIQFTLGSAPNQQFPLASPSSRFQIVGTPVTYECAANATNPELGTVIRHSGYDFQSGIATAPWAYGGSSAILVNNVSACSFGYTPAVLQRNGLVVLRLTLTRNGESVDLLHQVDVLNTP